MRGVSLPESLAAVFDAVGAFHAGPEEPGLPAGTRTVVLLGPRPGAMWDAFSASPEDADGAPDPLDRWTRRLVDAAAPAAGAVPVYPFGGPPYAPFIAWAGRGEGARPSPVGMLVAPGRGLWVAYRAALAYPELLEIAMDPPADPCAGCPAPCLTACPVGALGGDGYDVPTCVAHITSPEGAPCRDGGCMVRHACPAGIAPPDLQCGFHMRAFIGARSAT